MFVSAAGGQGVRNAGVQREGTKLLCLFSLSTTTTRVLLQLRSRLVSVHLTALHGRNHWDYVSIMLAVRCLLFATVYARYAETGKRFPRFKHRAKYSRCNK